MISQLNGDRMTAKDLKPHPPIKFNIQIDRAHYVVTESVRNGAELRAVANPTIGPERDLFEVVPGDVDKKIENDETVQITNGKRFFTATGHINPGRLE